MSHKSDSHPIFKLTDCPEDIQLLRYVQQKLSKEEIREVELHLSGCEICSDQVDGMRIAGSEAILTQDVAEINARIEKRIAALETKVIPISRYTYYTIAASLLLLLGIGFLFNYFVGEAKKETVAVLEDSKDKSEPIPSAEKSAEPTTHNKENIAPNATPPLIERKTQERPNKENTNSSESTKTGSSEKYTESIKSEDANLSLEKTSLETSVAEADEMELKSKEVVGKEILDNSKITSESTSNAPTVFSGQAAPAVAQVQVREENKVSNSKKRSPVSADNLDQLSAAKIDFTKGDYSSAKLKFEQLVKTDSKNEEAIFFLGKTERMLKEFNPSNSHLNLLLKQSKSIYYEEAEWLKALNLKDANNKSDALKLFSKIALGKGKYAYPAAEMKAELSE